MSAALGVRTTLIGAGVLGAAVTFAALLVPGVRQMDRSPRGGAGSMRAARMDGALRATA